MEVEKGEIITLSDNRDYLRLGTITDDGKKYLYLMTVKEPIDFCFVEEVTVNGDAQMRLVGKRDEKHRLFDLLKARLQTNPNRGTDHV